MPVSALAGGGPRPDPCAIVIFGASGDLTARKLIPALWNLFQDGRLPDGFSIIGLARTPKTSEQFRDEMRKAVAEHSRTGEPQADQWSEFAAGLFYLQGQYDRPETYQQLIELLREQCCRRGSCGNQLFYLSTPPSGYDEIIRQLGQAGLAAQGPGSVAGGWSRIMVEKPFGRDLASAKRLNAELRREFEEEQIYRIDHYLGKETIQNLLVFRFANGIFEPIWNRRYVDHVQISVAEKLGVEGRGASYEEAGALRDMIQNHLMQMMCLVAMEPPTRLDHRAIGNEKVKVLEAIRPITDGDVACWAARGQYAAGTIDGKPVPGYREEPGVDSRSRTETYAAVKFEIENWRWAGVPFYLRTGKRLPERVTEVSIHFRRAPHLLFNEFGDGAMEKNRLVIRVQPHEGIGLHFRVKVPGAGMQIRPRSMQFDYKDAFETQHPEAYERLLLDGLLGDLTLFNRADWMELSWTLIDPILCAWDQDQQALPQYPAGTWGPEEAYDLIRRDGRKWWISQQ